MRTKPHQQQHGFTLVELVMVIVIMGVISGIVAVFMRSPIEAYFSTVRRAAMADAADLTVRRMARDIRKALPNSLRTPSASCIEFIPTKTGGRYRADEASGGLSFSAAVTSFNMLGSNAALPSDQRIAANDVVVVYNLGISGSDAYAADNTARVSATPTESGSPPETSIPIDSTQFPLASGSSRFHVVPSAEKVVAYVCSAGNLYRTVNSTNFNSTNCQPTGPLLASKVSSCSFDYSGSDLQRNAVLRMALQMTDAGETISLQHQVNVSNTP
jgi:MSHA biogenesis protein MshO